MVKHIAIRMIWHDSKWNGTICNRPKGNFYCTGNYSLLSPRVQRRKSMEIEFRHDGQQISKSISDENYLPPCYWSANLLGKTRFDVQDPHPFADIKSWSAKFSDVPPLRDTLGKFSVFTWCFKLGYADEEDESGERYVPTKELEERVKAYLGEIKTGQSIAFFYANYSNPINGDDYRYLLLGAGLVTGTSTPPQYQIPNDILSDIRSRDGMQNFPERPWQFQITLDPDTIVLLPYHEYYDWVKHQDGTDAKEKWKKLDEISVPINENTLIPHFKYVSMHLSHDKCIYLLYQLRKSLTRIRDHNIISGQLIDEMEERLERLLCMAWKERGQYPGFVNLLRIVLKNDFDKSYLETVLLKIQSYVVKHPEGLRGFLESERGFDEVPGDVKRALGVLARRKELVKFFSMFDFSAVQFENAYEIVTRLGFRTVANNPYLLLENYHYAEKYRWNIDQSDYGLALYQIDIALIPDPKYVDWEARYDAQSPERLRAVVRMILTGAIDQQGSSCLTRDEIISQAKEYPLYYITENLELDIDRLLEYEKQPIFKEQIIIKEDFRGGEAVYQLKENRQIELTIEQFVGNMLQRKYDITEKDAEFVTSVVQEEQAFFKDKLDTRERRVAYERALGSGFFALSGKAGSGKTRAVVNLIRKFREDQEIPVFVFTPTGKANLVIRNRLKQLGLHKDTKIRVSTIHRFLYGAIWDFKSMMTGQMKHRAWELSQLVSSVLEGKLQLFDQLKSRASEFRFTPKVVIIDEASMVDEVLLAVLFCLIDHYHLKHIIIVGDERQLPPIGLGRPFVDIIFHLKRKTLDQNFIRLESNLRFDPSASLGALSEIFGGEKEPFPKEIEQSIQKSDASLETAYFEDEPQLKTILQNILNKIGTPIREMPLSDMFADTYETNTGLELDRIQILTPRRVGDFGSLAINVNVIRDGNSRMSPRTKLICEENMYLDVIEKRGRHPVLGLANGSIGYVTQSFQVYFDDLAELETEYQWVDTRKIVNEINEDRGTFKVDKKIDFGYAITVHKSQGSDFDYVVLVIPEISPFVVREILYTAFTRPKKKLFLTVNGKLKDEFAMFLANAYDNSAVEQRRTLLFDYKISPFKPYPVVLKNGKTIETGSKIERIIAKTFDEIGIEFEYGPEEFLEYHIRPDFKLTIDSETYYLEHLGNMSNLSYRNRWLRKFPIYKKLGIADRLVTTSETEESSDIENNIRTIVEDMRSHDLRRTEGGYSLHHYLI